MKKKLLITVLTIFMLIIAACGKKKEVEITEESVVDVSENAVAEEANGVTVGTEDGTASENSTSKTLSDDLYTFQISIDGKVVSLPMRYEQFMELGFTPSNETELAALDETLEPYTYSKLIYHKKGDAELSVAFYNFSENAVPIKECVMCAIVIDTEKPEEGLTAENITLPKGIQYGVSTLEDVKAAYGEPTMKTQGDVRAFLGYELNSDNNISFVVDLETNRVVYINICSCVPFKSGTTQTQAEKISNEIPEIVTKYVAPTELSDDLLDCTLEIDGDLYKLPFPVSEFIKNGWEIQETYSDRAIPYQIRGIVTLMRNNQTLHFRPINFVENKTGVQNCFIDSATFKSSDSPITIKLSEGIYMGMSEAEFLEIIKGKTNVKFDTSSEDYDRYYISNEDNFSKKFSVWIDKKTKTVQRLHVDFGEEAEYYLSK